MADLTLEFLLDATAEQLASGEWSIGTPVCFYDFPLDGRAVLQPNGDYEMVSGPPTMPRTVYIHVKNMPDANAQAANGRLLRPWFRELDYEQTANNPSTDDRTFRVFNTKPGFDGRANLTRAQVENYLNGWNASVTSASANEVIFDVNPGGVLNSQSFWSPRHDIAGISVTNSIYSQAQGGWRKVVDYSGAVDPYWLIPGKAGAHVLDRGGTVVSDVDQVITFDFPSNQVLKEMREDIFAKVEKLGLISKRDYVIDWDIVPNNVKNSLSSNRQHTVEWLTLKSWYLNQLTGSYDG